MNVQQEILETTSDSDEQIYALITIVQRLSDKVDALERSHSAMQAKLRGEEA